LEDKVTELQDEVAGLKAHAAETRARDCRLSSEMAAHIAALENA
jgi:hypothetical protein